MRIDTPLRLILVGPPGSGKGTAASSIKEDFGGAHISTGEILRDEVKLGTDLGQQAEVYMKQGLLVPDELMLKMVGGRLAKEDSFILDGFPRSIPQAEGLDRMLSDLGRPLTAVTLLDVSDDEVVKRLMARGREDDKEEVIRERLKVYHQQTEPMLTHFRRQGLVESVPAAGTIEDVAGLVNERVQDRRDGVAPLLTTPIPAQYLQEAGAGYLAQDLLKSLDSQVAAGTAPYPAAWEPTEVTARTKSFLEQSLASNAQLTLGGLGQAAKAYTEDELQGVKTSQTARLAGGVVAALGAPTLAAGLALGQNLVAGLGAAALAGGAVLGVVSHLALEQHRDNLAGLAGTRDLMESWNARLVSPQRGDGRGGSRG